jgi:hypothetical protein
MPTERQTKYGKVFNPEAPHDGETLPTRKVSMAIPYTPEWEKILNDLKKAAVDMNRSVSWVYREAVLDYHAKLMQTDTAQPLGAKSETTATTETKPTTVETPKPEQVQQPPKPPKPMIDSEKMTDDELRAAYNSPRLSSGEHQTVAYEMKKRGIYVKQEPV